MKFRKFNIAKRVYYNTGIFRFFEDFVNFFRINHFFTGN